MTDEELAVQARNGDLDAYGQLVRLHGARARHYAAALLHDRDEADDLAQDAFVRAFRALHHYDASRPFLPWFLRVLRNLCLNRIAARKRARTDLSLDTLEAQRTPDPRPTPLEVELHDEHLCRVRQAMARLSDPHREILELRHFQDLSYEAMAQVLDVPIGTVMSRLYNARKALMHELKRGSARAESLE
jgi:RNA polymerase sigma-70 factor (ECF subfamily)